MLALILIYLFSLMGFMFFRDDFSSHVQKRFYPSYASHRYRRTNATAAQKTTTRRSSSLFVPRCLRSFDTEPRIRQIIVFFFVFFSCNNSKSRWQCLLHQGQLLRDEHVDQRPSLCSANISALVRRSRRRSRTFLWHVVHVYRHNIEQRFEKWWRDRRCLEATVKPSKIGGRKTSLALTLGITSRFRNPSTSSVSSMIWCSSSSLSLLR